MHKATSFPLPFPLPAWKTMAAVLREKVLGSLLGLAVCDAVGTTVEFMPPGSFPPVTGMQGGGKFSLEPGEVSFNTSSCWSVHVPAVNPSASLVQGTFGPLCSCCCLPIFTWVALGPFTHRCHAIAELDPGHTFMLGPGWSRYIVSQFPYTLPAAISGCGGPPRLDPQAIYSPLKLCGRLN